MGPSGQQDVTWAPPTHSPAPRASTPTLTVGVGIAIARGPLHRSGRAVLPHPAPTSGSNVEALRGPWMADLRCREQVCVSRHPFPRDAGTLATSLKRGVPDVDDVETKRRQASDVPGYSVVAEVPGHNAPQVRGLCADG